MTSCQVSNPDFDGHPLASSVALAIRFVLVQFVQTA